MFEKNPAAVALGRLGGLANKGIPKPKSAINGLLGGKPKPKKKLRALHAGERRAKDGTIYRVPDQNHAKLFKKYSVRIREFRAEQLSFAEGKPVDDAAVERCIEAMKRGRAVGMLNIERHLGIPEVKGDLVILAAVKKTNRRALCFEVPARNREAFYSEIANEQTAR